MIVKSGQCSLYDKVPYWDEIEGAFFNLDNIRKLIFFFCEDKKNFQPECMTIFDKTDSYDSDFSYNSLFLNIKAHVEGIN